MGYGFRLSHAGRAANGVGAAGQFWADVEYFRQRGQLAALVRRTAIACAVLTTLSVIAISLLRTQFSLLVFGETDKAATRAGDGNLTGGSDCLQLPDRIAECLRMARVNAIVQFFNSLAFAGFSILLLLTWQREAASLVTAYGLSCLVLIGGMLWFLGRLWRELPHDEVSSLQTASGEFWSRLLPFAAWVWVTNLLYNLFDVVDRYMIVHTSRVADPLAEVGNYHSSAHRAAVVGFSFHADGHHALAAFEPRLGSGPRGAVSARMNLALKLLGLLLFSGSIVILLRGRGCSAWPSRENSPAVRPCCRGR